MTMPERISAVADIIYDACMGGCSRATANEAAVKICHLWERREQYELLNLKPGEIARKHRERYETDLTGAGIPLVDRDMS